MRISAVVVHLFFFVQATFADAPVTSISQDIYGVYASETNLQYQSDLPAGCKNAVQAKLNAAAFACGFGLIDSIVKKTPATTTNADVDATCKTIGVSCNAAVADFLAGTTVCGNHGIFSPVRGSPPDDHKTDSSNNSTEELLAAVLQGNKANLGVTGRTAADLATLLTSVWQLICTKDPSAREYCVVLDAQLAASAGIGSAWYYLDIQIPHLYSSVASLGSKLCTRCTQARSALAKKYDDVAILADISVIPLVLAANPGIGCSGEYTLASLDDQDGNPLNASSAAASPTTPATVWTGVSSAATVSVPL
ncbi:hypothetical protein SeMB42_g04802 [Synchytrium endobioticum]|uniref:Uncharacterized protein n=1 Tax=Synchytrium endobioticum TaxID=286115 RepID=A0A507DBV7_9FUNG|nr:hypothetical protein SeMB42_g04802 [Synchytrium endobioticum]TPX49132.1 hypothetical protein SeLEV6574_g01640 [Synchytrium endobioticum]